VLVAGDPSARMSDIRRVEIVVKDGVVMDVVGMRRALGMR
jgi:hypothetical protein